MKQIYKKYNSFFGLRLKKKYDANQGLFHIKPNYLAELKSNQKEPTIKPEEKKKLSKNFIAVNFCIDGAGYSAISNECPTSYTPTKISINDKIVGKVDFIYLNVGSKVVEKFPIDQGIIKKGKNISKSIIKSLKTFLSNSA